MSIFDTEPGQNTDADNAQAPPAGVSADGEITGEPAPAGTEAKIRQLREDLDGLAELVAEIYHGHKAEDGEPDPWCWPHLNPAAQTKLWAQLRGWVDWYNGRYGVTESSRIPGCWFRHPAVVEELTGLWVAWRGAYFGHGEPNDSPAYWHERLLWPTMSRITSQAWGLGKCRGGHKEPVNIPYGPSTDPDFEQFITASTVPGPEQEPGTTTQ